MSEREALFRDQAERGVAKEPPMTDEELALWRRDMRSQNRLPMPALLWEPARPLSPATLADLAPVPPLPPMAPPRTEDDIQLRRWAIEEWGKQDMARARRLTAIAREDDPINPETGERVPPSGLVAKQRRSQYEADRAYANTEEPLWVICVRNRGNAPESDCPPLALRAPDAATAEARYGKLNGLTLLNDGKGAQVYETAPYEVAPTPAT
jgi:hypothetical protein